MLFGVYELAEGLRKAGPGALGFLYYTGHGVAVGGENVLIPANLQGTSDAELSVRGVRLSEVVDILKNNAPDAVLFVVLDACRSNIRGQRGAKGFVPVTDQRTGVVLAFATAAGETASDDGSTSGPYAAALAEEIVKPGRNDQAVFNAVRARVASMTNRRQTPWTHDGLIGERIVFMAEPARPASADLTYTQYIERFGAGAPVLKRVLFPKEAIGPLAFGVLERSTAPFRGNTWHGGDDWGRIVFDATGRSARYFEEGGREAGEILIQGVLSDSGQTFGGTRGVMKSAELVGEWHQNDGKAEGGFILKPAGDEAVMSWGPLFRRESRWRRSAEILPPATATTTVLSGTTSPQARLSEAAEAWDRAKDITNIAVLEAFIARYKDTFYAELARARIDELKKQQMAVVAPPKSPEVGPQAKPAMTAPPPPPRCDGVEAQVGNEIRCLKPRDSFRDCPICPEMVVVPAGSFTMGSPAGEEGRFDSEGPRRKVTIAKPFAVGRFAVTQSEFATFVTETNHKIDGGCHTWRWDWEQQPGKSWRWPGIAQDEQHPVVCVNWGDAKAFGAWLSKKTGKSYRLLSEAEREYATRAGTSTPFWWGLSISTAQANYDGTVTYGGGSQGEYRQHTVRVDSFEPSSWGLYNVHGNVWDWTEDCWHENLQGAPTDGSAWTTACSDSGHRVIRGGSWLSSPRTIRSATRNTGNADFRYYDRGFRLARTFGP